MADEKPQETRPVGAPRLDQGGRDLDAQIDRPSEEPHPEEISREISAIFRTGEAARRAGEAHGMLGAVSEARTPGETNELVERARALLRSALMLLDFEGDDDD